MSIRNVSKKTILVEKVRIAKNLKDKTLGLLASKEPEVLLLRTRFGIHTFGMRYAIDIIVIDKQNKVVRLKQSLPPNSIFLWNPRYDTVLELPEQIIEKTHTQIGDILQIDEKT